MHYRTYSLSNYPGKKVSIAKAAERRALIGKRIGYDVRGSALSHYGTVTGSHAREIEIDGSAINISSIEQVVVLDKQP